MTNAIKSRTQLLDEVEDLRVQLEQCRLALQDNGQLLRDCDTSNVQALAFFEASIDGVLLSSPDGEIYAANKAAQAMLGRSELEICRLGRSGIVDTSDPRLSTFLAERARNGSARGELTLLRKDGSTFPSEVSSGMFFNHQGRIRTCIIFRDISRRKQLEQEVAEYQAGLEAMIRERTNDLDLANERLLTMSRAVEQSPASVVITDRSGLIEYVNQTFCDITGYTREEVAGQNPSILQSGKMPRSHYGELWRTIAAGQVWHGEFINRKKSGEDYWESASIAPIFNDDGVCMHYVGVKLDITERKEEEAARQMERDRLDQAMSQIKAYQEVLENQAATDFLTGLWNRRHFRDLALAEIARSRRYARPLALILLDIDLFKKINDSCGHPVGDMVLTHLAETVRSQIRHQDQPARIGGEEFAILLPETDLDAACATAERLRLAVAESSFSRENATPVSYTVSVGVAVLWDALQQAAQNDALYEELYRRADAALYMAKQGGRNQVKAA